VEALYTEFRPKQLECLGSFSEVISGVPGTVEGLRSRGIRIGSTTGYTRTMLDFLVERAREQGLHLDCAICPEDVPGGGRPAPWMCYLNAIRLGVTPFWSMVKIGDTPSDIEEGLNAGMWTIGVTRTGNEAGLTEAEWNSAGDAARGEVIAQARIRLLDAGAHFLVESAGECLDTIDEIADRISSGQRP
jgi:phosphonoacetaldehyde hydrolase